MERLSFFPPIFKKTAKKRVKYLAVSKKMRTFAPANRRKGASLVEESLAEIAIVL
jgi:hypothetical protein